MKYTEYEKAFSPARLNKYLKACNGDATAALMLYRHNIKLCQKCYGILNIFEVVLRNAINEHYKTFFADPNWIRNQLKSGGMLESHPQRVSVLQTIAELDKNGGKTLLKVFPLKAKGLGQRDIYNELQAVKAFRNRIAHHEAICFDAKGTKNTAGVRANYALVIQYIQFLGFPENHLYYGLDVLPEKTMRKIDLL